MSRCRRVIGVLFTDSLASLLIAALSRRGAPTGGRTALRHAPRALALAVAGAAALVVASLAAAGALEHLAAGLVALAAAGCAAHALVMVLFCVATVQPALGLARIRTALAVMFVPGLAVQGAGAALGGVAGAVAGFAVVNVVLAWWFVVVIRRATAAVGQATAEPVAGPLPGR